MTINHFEVNMIRRAFSFIIYEIFKCKKSKVDDRYWEGKRVYIERPSEPTDVYWENLSVKTIERVKRGFYTNLIAFGCLIVAFGINLGLSFIKEAIDNDSNTGGTSFESFLIRTLSILTSFFVVIINVTLGRIIRVLATYEKHETYSKYHLSVAVKLTIAMFINTGISPLFVNFGRENWFDAGGLMVDIFFNTLTISFISPLVYLLNPIYFIKLCRRISEKKKGDKSKLTQRQANALFEGPPLDMAQRYAIEGIIY